MARSKMVQCMSRSAAEMGVNLVPGFAPLLKPGVASVSYRAAAAVPVNPPSSEVTGESAVSCAPAPTSLNARHSAGGQHKNVDELRMSGGRVVGRAGCRMEFQPFVWGLDSVSGGDARYLNPKSHGSTTAGFLEYAQGASIHGSPGALNQATTTSSTAYRLPPTSYRPTPTVHCRGSRDGEIDHTFMFMLPKACYPERAVEAATSGWIFTRQPTRVVAVPAEIAGESESAALGKTMRNHKGILTMEFLCCAGYQVHRNIFQLKQVQCQPNRPFLYIILLVQTPPWRDRSRRPIHIADFNWQPERWRCLSAPEGNSGKSARPGTRRQDEPRTIGVNNNKEPSNETKAAEARSDPGITYQEHVGASERERACSTKKAGIVVLHHPDVALHHPDKALYACSNFNTEIKPREENKYG
ncbi:hypothetical protein C8R46DRAFT_1045406 [Mycena filopes]|nr:hypothetical protein C8R46DRAFT_1045406 [Mycena filopes]